MDDKLVCFIPLVSAHVHLESLNVFASLDEEGLSLVVLADLGVVTSDLDLVGANLVSRLVLYKVDGAVPVACGQCGLDSLVKDTGLDEVVHSLIELALGYEPVTPLFFECHHMVGERLLGKVNGLFEGVAHYEGIESSVKKRHLLEEVASLLVHV